MIIISARRWFDRRYGNTYHSVSVNVDGQEKGRNPFAYGYGEQYLQSAAEILGVEYGDMRDDMRENRDKYFVTVSDVSRKKDL